MADERTTLTDDEILTVSSEEDVSGYAITDADQDDEDTGDDLGDADLGDTDDTDV